MFDIKASLIGFVPKKGTGVLDDGTPWTTDRVDLHCLTPLDSTRGAKGYSSTIYKIPNCDANQELASNLVGKDIVISCDMTTKGSGGSSVITPMSFSAAK